MRIFCLIALVITLIATSPSAHGARSEKKVADEDTVTDRPESSLPTGIDSDTDDEAPSLPSGIDSESYHQAPLSHKGIVLLVKETADYSFVKLLENGKEIWMATVKSDVKKGDIIEFPDSTPYAEYYSKALNMKFNDIIFAPGLRKLQGSN